MRILVASHTYIVDLNCEKLRTLAHLEPGVEVTVVVPKRWQPGGVQNRIIETKAWSDRSFRVVPISNFSQNNQGLLTFGTDIIELLKQFRPQIIQVEQGAKSFAYAQLITLNRLLGLKAKNVFFTWWNLPYQSKFPVSVLENYNLAHTDGLVAGNLDAAEILRDRGYKKAVTVMPQLGVDERLFSRRLQPELASQLGIKSEEFVVGFVGRFVPEKGILTLVKALTGLQELPWKLLLLGRGSLKETIITEASKAGIQDRLIILESVPHHEVPCYINLMNVLVLPSETTDRFKTLTAAGWKEQFGHVLIEAMATKIPVIGSNSGEIPNVIGEAGLVFPEGNFEALRHCIRQIIERPELSQKLAWMGYKRVMENYTNKALAQQLLAFYKKLLVAREENL
ncbi:MAG: glycosyltransferase family 4 protein [Hydrococcus sp. C42_A2020_068]|uniref:hormogonium polysaccharide biosynthesis glycosyltransferase HpsO n=1 Tax=Pleurocapsa sp. PCC 7327 TaxID=118163 RepID=UPI00029FD27C|nr:hormogonium polysaccharide biosynthesis glycosyltransferase HpsO [Pleurocapsa sp. PCC 7327]AFY75654.1 glycosyltransferase [Pleurocapsa sp. PCC 7327]MBF2020153.1 glycosyltransferase family 4 protein [Hydrococcus sp. C42_A2020_068]